MANCRITKPASGYKLKISKVDEWLRMRKITEYDVLRDKENDAYDGKKNLLIMNIKPDASTEGFKFNNEVVYTTYINLLLERIERVRSATLTRMEIGSKSGELHYPY